MAIQKEIQDYMEKHIEMLVSQTKTYLPFIKVAFPNTNISEACYGLIAGNALSIFLNQYAMRMQYPSPSDFEEFGQIMSKYKGRVEEFFK